MKDIRDAFFLWFAANVALAIGATLHSFADLPPLPLQIAMVAMAVTAYVAGTALFGLGGVSLVTGIRSLRARP
jgi:hypothetical protein